MSSEGPGREVGCPVCGYRTLRFKGEDAPKCPNECIWDHPDLLEKGKHRGRSPEKVLHADYGIVTGGGDPYLVEVGSAAWKSSTRLRAEVAADVV